MLMCLVNLLCYASISIMAFLFNNTMNFVVLKPVFIAFPFCICLLKFLITVSRSKHKRRI